MDRQMEDQLDKLSSPGKETDGVADESGNDSCVQPGQAEKVKVYKPDLYGTNAWKQLVTRRASLSLGPVGSMNIFLVK